MVKHSLSFWSVSKFITVKYSFIAFGVFLHDQMVKCSFPSSVQHVPKLAWSVFMRLKRVVDTNLHLNEGIFPAK